jgi:hypothetical protein
MENISITFNRWKKANPRLSDQELNELIKNSFEERYKFRHWVIIIQDYFGTKNIQGTAIKEKVFLKYGESYQLEGDDQIDFDPEDGWKYGVNSYEKNEVINYLAEQTILSDAFKKHNRKEVEKLVNKLKYRFYDHEYTILERIKKPLMWEPYNYPILKKGIIPRGRLHSSWALMVRVRDKKCIKCGAIEDLHAHHVNSYKDHEELRYDVNNGTTYCGDCHREWHKENGR